MGKVLNLKASNVFHRNMQAATKIVANQGGTRSGKTYSILQLLIFEYALKQTGRIFTIVRKTLPSIKLTVLRDFLEILDTHDMYDETAHNKSDHTYKLNGNLFEFVSLDQPQKKRGAKRNILFCNEANELTYEDFFQLLVRTEEKIYLDYNPSDAHHWLYDKVIPRDDCTFIKSTYRDNPFLPQTLVQEIERLKTTDDNYWRVYGLGERGQSQSLVFSRFNEVKDVQGKFIAYGLDWGYSSDPTALVAIYKDEDNLYIHELLHERGLTNQDIAEKLRGLGIDRRDEIYADSAEPKSIEELHRMGFNCKPCIKGKGSIELGIDTLRRHTLHVTETSLNLINELRNYKYIQDKSGRLTNKPVDAFNHLIDATRYACSVKLTKPNSGVYHIM